MELIDKLVDVVLEAEKLSETDKIVFLNESRRLLDKISPFKNEPVDIVQWIKNDKIIANDYNPNKVAPPEMKLLELSIKEDGYTQPIVTYYDETQQKYVIVDGFHRSRVGKECTDIKKRMNGYLPIVVIDKPIGDRIASTIRHNRARGTHDIDLMSDLVAELHRLGKTDHWIGKNLGMDADEVLRLKQIGGLADMFRDKEFSQSWDVIDQDVELGTELDSIKIDISMKDEKGFVTGEQLESIIRDWNPEKGSVESLQKAFNAYGDIEKAFETPSLEEAILHIPIAEDFEEMIEVLPVDKREKVLTCDGDGFCLMYDTNEIKHISEL